MTDRRDRPIMTRDVTGYQNKMMGDYEKRGLTTAHLRRPPPESIPKPADKPTEPAATQSSSTSKPASSAS